MTYNSIGFLRLMSKDSVGPILLAATGIAWSILVLVTGWDISTARWIGVYLSRDTGRLTIRYDLLPPESLDAESPSCSVETTIRISCSRIGSNRGALRSGGWIETRATESAI
jgi:hypothetical protein